MMNLASGADLPADPRCCTGSANWSRSLVFFSVAYTSITVLCWHLGTGSGLPFLLPRRGDTLMVLILGSRAPRRSPRCSLLSALRRSSRSRSLVPYNTGVQPDWAFRLGFILSVVYSAWVMVVAVVSVRRCARSVAPGRRWRPNTERSETTAHQHPAGCDDRRTAERPVAQHHCRQVRRRLNPVRRHRRLHQAGQRHHASRSGALSRPPLHRPRRAGRPARPGKVKTSGDSYMVVSGVPQPRGRSRRGAGLPCAGHGRRRSRTSKDPQGREVPLRIGLAARPVVAGVVGARKFFYDVWGDAVNVAARMETTDVEGRIQVPHDVYRAAQPRAPAGGARRGGRQGQGPDAHLVSGRARDDEPFARGRSTACRTAATSDLRAAG